MLFFLKNWWGKSWPTYLSGVMIDYLCLSCTSLGRTFGNVSITNKIFAIYCLQPLRLCLIITLCVCGEGPITLLKFHHVQNVPDMTGRICCGRCDMQEMLIFWPLQKHLKDLCSWAHMDGQFTTILKNVSMKDWPHTRQNWPCMPVMQISLLVTMPIALKWRSAVMR